MKTEEIKQITKEIENAMIEMIDASNAVDEASARKKKAQHRLVLAKDALRAITF